MFHDDDDDDDLHMVITVMTMVVIMVIFPGILEQPFFRVGRFLFDSGRAPDWAGLWNLHIFGIYHFLFFFFTLIVSSPMQRPARQSSLEQLQNEPTSMHVGRFFLFSKNEHNRT